MERLSSLLTIFINDQIIDYTILNCSDNGNIQIMIEANYSFSLEDLKLVIANTSFPNETQIYMSFYSNKYFYYLNRK